MEHSWLIYSAALTVLGIFKKNFAKNFITMTLFGSIWAHLCG
jgi:hypothetical protein